jgi:hypothetical protein
MRTQTGYGLTGGALSAKDYKKKKRKRSRAGKANADTAASASSKKTRVDPAEAKDDVKADAAVASYEGDVKVGTASKELDSMQMPPPVPRWARENRPRNQVKISRKPPSDKKTRAWDNKLRAIAALQTPEQPIWRTERTKKTTYKGPGRSKIYKVNTKTTVVSRNKKQVYDCTRIRKGGRTKNVGPCRPVITDNTDGDRFQAGSGGHCRSCNRSSCNC